MPWNDLALHRSWSSGCGAPAGFSETIANNVAVVLSTHRDVSSFLAWSGRYVLQGVAVTLGGYRVVREIVAHPLQQGSGEIITAVHRWAKASLCSTMRTARRTQSPVTFGSCRFDSHLRHQQINR